MKYYTDGFCRAKNPSPYGGGYTITNESGNLIKQIEVEKAGFTNNEGELLGVLEASKICDMGDSISTDSMNTIGWVSVGKSKSRPDLNPLLQEAKQIIAQKKINLMWERRDFNLAGIHNEKLSSERMKKYGRKKMNDTTLVGLEEEYERQQSFLSSI